MTDKELLELAAKAAAIKIDKSPYNGGGYGNTGFDMNGDAVLDWHNNKTWNPLTDDGDALRLAVKLKINLQFETIMEEPFLPSVNCGRWSGLNENDDAPDWAEEALGSDPCAATRRAIVRAAAEIESTL